MADNKMYQGDNLAVLREEVATESVDLIYLDPPFNSQATYNVTRSSGALYDAGSSRTPPMSKPAKLPSDPERYRRFVATARELGCDESEERFAEVVRTVARAPVPSASEIKARAKAARKAGRKP